MGSSDDRDAARQAMPFVRKGLTSQSLHFSIDEVQSRMLLQRPDALDLRYTRTMMGFLAFLPAPDAIAIVGLGGGSLVNFCHRHLPRARIDVAEINPHVIALRTAFRVPPDSRRLRVFYETTMSDASAELDFKQRLAATPIGRATVDHHTTTRT